MLWVSLGENCLSDNILERHGLKSFSTPYSHGRSNIDYAVALEEDRYSVLLNSENLTYADDWGKKVVRSTRYNAADNIFESSVSQGFEFTHHDVIENSNAKSSYLRKIERMLDLRLNSDDVVFLYHHRIGSFVDFESIYEKASNFLKFYENGSRKIFFLMFSQERISGNSSRSVFLGHSLGSVFHYKLVTESIWGGNDPDAFWAKSDDDLISWMLSNFISIVTE